MDNKRWIYDEEMYPNAFILCAKNVDTKQRVSFQISPYKNDKEALARWLLNDVVDMVGYNNLFYDYQLLDYLIKTVFNLRGRDIVAKMYRKSSYIINKSRYPKKTYHLRKQIDLFKINHFDNVNKSTSLKLLEFNLKMKNIQDLPYPVGTVLTKQQIDNVVDYCFNDVDATEEVYYETLPEIELREKMSAMFDIDFTNYNSTKMGEHILIKKIAEQLGEHVVYSTIEQENGGFKKIPRNTVRESIDLSEAVFDYITFKTEPFKRILEWFKSRVITETNGVFSNIPIEELEIIEGYYALKCVKWHPGKEKMVWASLVDTKNRLKTLNIVNFGFQYDFGVGGIHGSVLSGIYEADDEYEMRDIDVTSYYPKLAIENKFYPEQYGVEFCEIYESIFIERQKYPKKTPENLAMKLALNGSFGKSNSQHSCLYDPMYTMKTTINGQLLLCKLSEELMLNIPGCQMIQINTDGMTIKFKRSDSHLVDSICKEWENYTQLELEAVNYSRMIIKDVNNYLALSTDGYVKRKGAAFIYKKTPGELELNKNFSQLVVPKVVESYFVDGVIPEDFLHGHNDIFDFFKRTKIKRSDRLWLKRFNEKGNEIFAEETQRITRYVISGEIFYDKETKLYNTVGSGYSFVKEMPPLPGKDMVRNNSIESGYLCTPWNVLPDNLDSIKNIIYYPYYIKEVYKTINIIENEAI
jgi:hypothetical protein